MTVSLPMSTEGRHCDYGSPTLDGLPVPTLFRIFDYLSTRDIDGIKNAKAISQVSRKIREVALNRPDMWLTISNKQTLSDVDQFIQRSAQSEKPTLYMHIFTVERLWTEIDDNFVCNIVCKAGDRLAYDKEHLIYEKDTNEPGNYEKSSFLEEVPWNAAWFLVSLGHEEAIRKEGNKERIKVLEAKKPSKINRFNAKLRILFNNLFVY